MLNKVLINVDLPRPDSPTIDGKREGGSVRFLRRKGRGKKRTDDHGGEMETYFN